MDELRKGIGERESTAASNGIEGGDVRVAILLLRVSLTSDRHREDGLLTAERVNENQFQGAQTHRYVPTNSIHIINIYEILSRLQMPN